MNDSSSRQLWTEWDAEAEEDVGLCGGERQVHRTTPANKEKRSSPNRSSIPFTTTIQENGTALMSKSEKNRGDLFKLLLLPNFTLYNIILLSRSVLYLVS